MYFPPGIFVHEETHGKAAEEETEWRDHDDKGHLPHCRSD